MFSTVDVPHYLFCVGIITFSVSFSVYSTVYTHYIYRVQITLVMYIFNIFVISLYFIALLDLYCSHLAALLPIFLPSVLFICLQCQLFCVSGSAAWLLQLRNL